MSINNNLNKKIRLYCICIKLHILDLHEVEGAGIFCQVIGVKHRYYFKWNIRYLVIKSPLMFISRFCHDQHKY